LQVEILDMPENVLSPFRGVNREAEASRGSLTACTAQFSIVVQLESALKGQGFSLAVSIVFSSLL
jgi:hypothetical protein